MNERDPARHSKHAWTVSAWLVFCSLVLGSSVATAAPWIRRLIVKDGAPIVPEIVLKNDEFKSVFDACLDLTDKPLPETTPGINNAGIEKCSVIASAPVASELNFPQEVVIKYSQTASLECTALKIAGGNRAPEDARGAAYCYGTLSNAGAPEERSAALVMEVLTPTALNALSLPNVVAEAMIALGNLHNSGLGCFDCEWAFVPSTAERVKAKVLDMTGPARQLHSAITGKVDPHLRDLSKHCAQYGSVYDYFYPFLSKAMSVNDIAEGKKLHDILEYIELTEPEILTETTGLSTTEDVEVWSSKIGLSDYGCPRFCVTDLGALKTWYEKEVCTISVEHDASIAPHGKGEQSCSIAGKIVYLLLSSVSCHAPTVPEESYPKAIQRMISEKATQ